MDPTLRGKYRMLQMCITGTLQCKGVAVRAVAVTGRRNGRIIRHMIPISPTLGKYRMLNIGFGGPPGQQEAGLFPSSALTERHVY